MSKIHRKIYDCLLNSGQPVFYFSEQNYIKLPSPLKLVDFTLENDNPILLQSVTINCRRLNHG